MKDQIDRHRGQEAEERRTDRRQRHQQPGNAVLISSLPELTTELAPLVTEVATMLNANNPRVRW